ncbi:MarR family transcriptional regulator [Lentilactobacillus sp. Marseille-Q4993]|uniref:MarR family winged helix-turn-helix transcriptional regulator n=1 Tax=Lentilactobacillus sp. Marseille-Q4993 TaxID=3039492 RepID=UPI0024BD19FC|nr:MarR family transcriptional regulator [Lentilactobacillus sp. Marseille-Q4993]
MPKDMQLANQLCFSVYNANRLFNKFYQKALSDFDLTYPQYVVLLALWEEDNQSLHELGQKLDLESNTLTPLLKRLEKAGWVIRHRDENDRRQLIVSLTESGITNKDNVYRAISNCVGNEAFNVKQYQEALKMNDQLIAELTDLLK